MTHRCWLGSSVDLDFVCPKCGGEGIGDYNCHSGEEAVQCSVCGWGSVSKIVNRETARWPCGGNFYGDKPASEAPIWSITELPPGSPSIFYRVPISDLHQMEGPR